MKSILPSLIASAFIAFAPACLFAGWQNFEEADVILGRQTLPAPATVHMPQDIAASSSGKMFVADSGHHRVLRYSSAAALGNGQAAEAVFGQANISSGEPDLTQSGLNGPQSVAIDSAGNLWVSDTENNRVLRWINADTAASGSAAAQVLGQPNFTSKNQAVGAAGMSRPAGLTTDTAGRLWVADYFNNRILRFDNAATKGNGGSADAVIGQPNFTSSSSGLSQTEFSGPIDLTVDAAGRLWVAELFNARVLRFDTPLSSSLASGVLGQTGFASSSPGSDAAQMNFPASVSISSAGSLFVSDSQNSRIVRWDNAASKANGAAGDGVLGRLNLASGAATAPVSGEVTSAVRGLMVDAANRLWVADRFYERVLRWDNAPTKANGAVADGVIGQPTTSTTAQNTVVPAAGVTSAQSGYEDPASGKFFICDNGRVLRFATRNAAEAGFPPEAFLGKPDGTTTGGGSSATTINSTWGVAMDSAGSLWVTDRYSNRVVSFANAATTATGSSVAVVLGQINSTSTGSGLSATKFSEPRGLAIDGGGNLYVADSGNHRVLRFANITSKTTGAAADAVIGQANLTSASTAASTALLKSPSGVSLDTQGRLWVADSGNNRVVRYNTPLTSLPTDPPSGFLGGVGSVVPNGMFSPTSAVATPGGRLWVMDGFNRILRFDNAASKADGSAADGVLGAPNLNTLVDNGRSRKVFAGPECLFLDAAANLWVADSTNFRLLKFVPSSSAIITSSSRNGLGQFTFTFIPAANTLYNLRSSTDLKNWSFVQSYNVPNVNPLTFTNTTGGTQKFFRLEEP